MNALKKSRILLKIFVFGCLCMQSVFAQPGSGETLENKILAIMQENKAVGLAVAVVKNGELDYVNSFGYQHIEKQKPLEIDHVFRIASISKSFTSTGIMQLIEKGHFTLDSDFSDLVGFTVRNPHFPEEVITLRMVLSHTSSINDSQGYFKLDVIDPGKNPEWQKSYNDYKPGTQYQYCNLNFNLAGAVIERYSEERFDQYIVNHILNPLGLYGGYCIDSLNSELFAALYAYNKDKDVFTESVDAYHPRREELKTYKNGYSAPIFSPTGGMKISAPDLAKYMIMHMNFGTANGKRIISANSAREMQTPVLASSQYGLALSKVKNYIEGEELVGHTGSAYGLYSNLFFHPEKKFGIVLITNGCVEVYDQSYVKLLKDVANLIYEERIR